MRMHRRAAHAPRAGVMFGLWQLLAELGVLRYCRTHKKLTQAINIGSCHLDSRSLATFMRTHDGQRTPMSNHAARRVIH